MVYLHFYLLNYPNVARYTQTLGVWTSVTGFLMWVHSDFVLSKFLWFRPWSVLLGSDAVRWSVRSARWIGTGDLWKRNHGQAAVSENRSYIYIIYHYMFSEKFKAACWNKSLLINLYMVVSSIHSCHSKAFGKTTLNRIEADLWTTCMMFSCLRPWHTLRVVLNMFICHSFAHKCMILMEHLSCTSTGF